MTNAPLRNVALFLINETCMIAITYFHARVNKSCSMYKPFLEFLEKELFQRFDLQSRVIPPGLEFKVSDRGRNPATIRSWCYQCQELRKIRYTYIDAGESAQIFNSVVYPSHYYDLPLLGIDFLSFGKVKNLIVLDFQPLFQESKI